MHDEQLRDSHEIVLEAERPSQPLGHEPGNSRELLPPERGGGISVGSTFHGGEERQREEMTLETDLLGDANKGAAGPVGHPQVREQWSRVVGLSGLCS